jgi:pimeloyl-ACP methyl ester carboxylesterase
MISEALMNTVVQAATATRGYAPINGLKMYYEIEGTGEPLVYIHAALGHAGLNSFPELAVRHSVIKIDLQAHGRTADIPERPLSIEHYAEDVAALLKHLGITKADFFGQSYGGATAVMLAVRHPAIVRRVVAYGATYGPPAVAHNPDMLRFEAPPTADARSFDYLRESYESVAPDPNYWSRMWNKVAELDWQGFSHAELASITAPVLIIVGDRDFVHVEHALETMKVIRNAELAVVPDAGHFALYSEQEKVIPIVQEFLEWATTPVKPDKAADQYDNARDWHARRVARCPP